MKTKYLLPAILLASSSYLANAQSPQSDTISGKTKQELIKNISITETINHDSIIKTPIDTIINMY